MEGGGLGTRSGEGIGTYAVGHWTLLLPMRMAWRVMLVRTLFDEGGGSDCDCGMWIVDGGVGLGLGLDGEVVKLWKSDQQRSGGTGATRR